MKLSVLVCVVRDFVMRITSKSRRSLVVSAQLVLALLSASALADEGLQNDDETCPNAYKAIVVGTARHLESNALIYCEYHILQPSMLSGQPDAERALIVRYFDGAGEEIATKSVVLGANAFQPEINQQDFRSGEQRIAKREAEGRWVMTYQESANDKIKIKHAELDEMGVVDSGFNQFIKTHWDTLHIGEPKVVEFLSVPHLKTITLQVKKVSCEPGESGDTSARVCFGIQINNAFLRLITGELYLEYNAEKQLVLFEGVVNIRNEKEKTQKAQVRYRYFD